MDRMDIPVFPSPAVVAPFKEDAKGFGIQMQISPLGRAMQFRDDLKRALLGYAFVQYGADPDAAIVWPIRVQRKADQPGLAVIGPPGVEYPIPPVEDLDRLIPLAIIANQSASLVEQDKSLALRFPFEADQ